MESENYLAPKLSEEEMDNYVEKKSQERKEKGRLEKIREIKIQDLAQYIETQDDLKKVIQQLIAVTEDKDYFKNRDAKKLKELRKTLKEI